VQIPGFRRKTVLADTVCFPTFHFFLFGFAPDMISKEVDS